MDNLEDCVETGRLFPRQSFVKTFTGETRVTGYLRHALGTGNIAESFCDTSCVARSIFNDRCQISGHLLRSAQVLSYIESTGLPFFS